MRKYQINTAAEWNAVRKNLKYRRCLIEFYSQRVTKRKCTQQESASAESPIFPTIHHHGIYQKDPPEDQKALHQCSLTEGPPSSSKGPPVLLTRGAASAAQKKVC